MKFPDFISKRHQYATKSTNNCRSMNSTESLNLSENKTCPTGGNDDDDDDDNDDTDNLYSAVWSKNSFAMVLYIIS